MNNVNRPRDYYFILNVTSNASASEIRRAYRRLALESHPDHHPEDPESEEKFKLISEAYSILGDVHKRSDYDRRYDPRTVFFDTHDSFDMSMGSRYWPPGRGNGCGRRKCGFAQNTVFNDVQVGQIYEISLTPEESHRGTERFVAITVDQKRRGYRIRIPAGVSQATQFKAILGRDEDRYILCRITIKNVV